MQWIFYMSCCRRIYLFRSYWNHTGTFNTVILVVIFYTIYKYIETDDIWFCWLTYMVILLIVRPILMLPQKTFRRYERINYVIKFSIQIVFKTYDIIICFKIFGGIVFSGGKHINESQNIAMSIFPCWLED